jgi:hypothetical protein
MPSHSVKACAKRAAGDEAADGRVLARGRVEAQLVCGGRERAIDVEHARAGAETSGTRPVPDQLIEPGHIEHDPARERHRLAVISGSAAAHGERHPVPGAGRGEAHHVGLVAWHHDDVGALVVQCLLQNRREPEEIAAFHPQRSRVFQNRNVAQVLTKQSGDGHRADSRFKPKAWYSKSAVCHPFDRPPFKHDPPSNEPSTISLNHTRHPDGSLDSEVRIRVPRGFANFGHWTP